MDIYHVLLIIICILLFLGLLHEEKKSKLFEAFLNESLDRESQYAEMVRYLVKLVEGGEE